jgi:D-alanine-D-alanine ligase-like ATP-grasp enzyme
MRLAFAQFACMIPVMKRKKESLLLGPLLKRLGKRIGAKVVIEPQWRVVGQITFKSGKRSYFRYNTLDLNPVGASDVAKDKDYATFFMRAMGYPTIQGEAFFSDEWCVTIGSKRDIDAAYRFAQKIGFPVIVKPNSGSQGAGVSPAYDKKGFYRAMRSVFKADKVALVQVMITGKDFRIVVLDNEIISAYQRIPLNVIGDGRSSVKQLLAKKEREFIAMHRDTRIKLNDPRISNKLSHQGLTLQSKPTFNKRIFLLDNANLSTGGDSIDVTDSIHPAFKKIAISLTKDMGLRLCGVDLMIDGEITEKPSLYRVIEINAAPGLDHYVRSGKAQQKIVEDLYLKVLKHLEK